MRISLLAVIMSLMMLSGCATRFDNQDPTGQFFPGISGERLDQQPLAIPGGLDGRENLLLIGYKQNAQFDIDRWMIGIDMIELEVSIIELAAIQGFFPRLFKARINDGMRAGIPHEAWRSVVTAYRDGERIQAFTGNTNPGNARVALLDQEGRIIYFYDRGFSVAALKRLKAIIQNRDANAPGGKGSHE